MFHVNDTIVYGSHGVCRVEAVGPLSMSAADKGKEYYTLRPVYQSDSVLYAPVDNEKIVMRKTLTKEEAQGLIGQISELEDEWIANEKEREQHYKNALRSCDCRELVKLIKALYEHNQKRVRVGKRARVVDERYFRKAEEQLNEELAFALDMDMDNVKTYIKKEMEEQQNKM